MQQVIEMKQDSRVMRSGWVSGSAGWDIAQHRQNYHKYQELAFQGPTAGTLKIQVPAESLLTSLESVLISLTTCCSS